MHVLDMSEPRLCACMAGIPLLAQWFIVSCCLTAGKPPFNGANHVALLRTIERQEAAIPESLAACLSASCIAMLYGLLRRNPVERMGFEEFFTHPFLRSSSSNNPLAPPAPPAATVGPAAGGAPPAQAPAGGGDASGGSTGGSSSRSSSLLSSAEPSPVKGRASGCVLPVSPCHVRLLAWQPSCLGQNKFTELKQVVELHEADHQRQ